MHDNNMIIPLSDFVIDVSCNLQMLDCAPMIVTYVLCCCIWYNKIRFYLITAQTDTNIYIYILIVQSGKIQVSSIEHIFSF